MASEPEGAAPPELAEGYYADNFRTVLDTVCERYEDLLSPAELAFVATYRTASLPAQRLYVRLISRKGPCFRRDRLQYPEIADLDAALAELSTCGLVDDGADEAPEAWLALLLRPELDRLAQALGWERRAGLKKPELVAELVAGVEAPKLRQEIDARFRVLRPLGQELLKVFRLLFFGNLGQDWTEFVLRDLGVVRYETYSLRRELRAFDERRAIDHQLVLRRVREEVTVALFAGDLETARTQAAQLTTDDWHPTGLRLREHTQLRLAQALERAGELPEALALYAEVERPPARERRVRGLEKLGQLDEALALARAMVDSPSDETEAAFAPRAVHRLRRALGETLDPWRRPRRPTRELTVEKQEGTSVEQRVLETLAEIGRVGFFAENWLWKSLFGLAFWDIVFAPVPGVFQHPFQLGPLDLRSSTFRARRAEAIEARLAALRSDPDPGPWLLERYDAKFGIANAFVAWFDGGRELLELALEPVQGEHLAAVCDRLSRDPKRYRRGLPDLFVLREEAPGFELLEVKAPGDQLRPEQGAWIDYLGSVGIPAAILKVHWA